MKKKIALCLCLMMVGLTACNKKPVGEVAEDAGEVTHEVIEAATAIGGNTSSTIDVTDENDEVTEEVEIQSSDDDVVIDIDFLDIPFVCTNNYFASLGELFGIFGDFTPVFADENIQQEYDNLVKITENSEDAESEEDSEITKSYQKQKELINTHLEQGTVYWQTSDAVLQYHIQDNEFDGESIAIVPSIDDESFATNQVRKIVPISVGKTVCLKETESMTVALIFDVQEDKVVISIEKEMQPKNSLPLNVIVDETELLPGFEVDMNLGGLVFTETSEITDETPYFKYEIEDMSVIGIFDISEMTADSNARSYASKKDLLYPIKQGTTILKVYQYEPEFNHETLILEGDVWKEYVNYVIEVTETEMKVTKQ